MLGAVAGGLLGSVVCNQSENPNENCTKDIVGIGLLGGGLGGLAGLLVGGLFPKGAKTQSADSAAH